MRLRTGILLVLVRSWTVSSRSFPCTRLSKAIQASVLWYRMITHILINVLQFSNTAHERNLYHGTIDGHSILVCQQIDDFASESATKEGAELFMVTIQKHFKSELYGMGMKLPASYFAFQSCKHPSDQALYQAGLHHLHWLYPPDTWMGNSRVPDFRSKESGPHLPWFHRCPDESLWPCRKGPRG